MSRYRSDRFDSQSLRYSLLMLTVNHYRASITTKCTDEAKLYRNRQHRYAHAHQANNTLEDMENVPPSPVSSESSHPTD